MLDASYMFAQSLSQCGIFFASSACRPPPSRHGLPNIDRLLAFSNINASDLLVKPKLTNIIKAVDS